MNFQDTKKAILEDFKVKSSDFISGHFSPIAFDAWLSENLDRLEVAVNEKIHVHPDGDIYVLVDNEYRYAGFLGHEGTEEEAKKGQRILSNAFPGPKEDKRHPCSDPELKGHCTGCTDRNSEGTHQCCTIEHGHFGCDKE